MTGSFNFTKAAESSSSENLLVIHDPKLAARYLANWAEHRAHSEGYAGRYTGIESHQGLTHYGLYDTVVAKE